MKIFDMHIHTGYGSPNPKKLIENMEKGGVYGGALISAAPLDATANLYKLPAKDRIENIIAWTKGYEDRLIPVLWISPFDENCCEVVKTAVSAGIKAFKVICDTFPVYCDENMRLMNVIEAEGKPVLFHTGILWSGTDTSKYNRPADFECLLNLDNLKFSMGHCSWPWHDECIAVYGKFLNYYLKRRSSEMFFDITPGTPKIYREDLLTKLFTVGYDVENNIMFGTDSLTTEYSPAWVSDWLKTDNEIFDKLGVTDEQREKIYEKNFMRFLSGGNLEHNLPHMNK